MTKKTLVEMKLAVIMYHNGDNMDYLLNGIARDACYTSYNSINYKKKQIADNLADLETAIVENRDVRADAIARRLDNMEIELNHLTERHDADKEVYSLVTDGEQWTPERKSRNVSGDLAKRVAELKKKVA
jgi:hypothetical protein